MENYKIIKVLSARERSPLSIPLSEILDTSGHLKLHHIHTQQKGLVEVRQSSGKLVLKINGVVGRLPITNELAVDIAPKFSMTNLARLMSLSDENITNRIDIDRLYKTSEPDGFLPELLLRTFADFICRADNEGRHREYLKKSSIQTLRPKINFQKSSQHFWSRGKLTDAIVEQFIFSQNNAENQTLKLACRLAFSLCKHEPSLKDERAIFARMLRDYQCVSDINNLSLIPTYSDALTSIPSFKVFYRRSVRIALEIITRSGVAYDSTISGISMPSYIINLDNAFESYIRNVLHDGLAKEKLEVGDGNLIRWRKSLFNDSSKHNAKPDLLIYKEGARLPVIVGDMKYKEKLNAEDRYQVITHTLSYKSKIAVLISPAKKNQVSQLLNIGTIGPGECEIKYFEYKFDLSGDFENEEQKMCKAISSLSL